MRDECELGLPTFVESGQPQREGMVTPLAGPKPKELIPEGSPLHPWRGATSGPSQTRPEDNKRGFCRHERAAQGQHGGVEEEDIGE